jgi:peptidoglycan/xylan/chitin deacetylase (PgdA/CDA1 family)
MNTRTAIAHAFVPLTAWYYRCRPGIRILMYHRVRAAEGYDQLTVSPATFASHMAHLRECLRPVSLREAVDEISAGIASPAVAVTFDDGYLDNLTVALPILERYRIPATIFVTVDFCRQLRTHPRYHDEMGRVHLTVDEIRRLADHPLVTIGSHTLTHPFLSRLDSTRARAEIVDSRTVLEELLGKPVEFFCYPSGDYGEREAALVADAGYRAAVTVAPGQNAGARTLFELRRTEMTDRDDREALAQKLRGAYDLPHAYLHWRRMRRFRSARHHAPATAEN